jgi:CBS domain-containing protein
MFMELRDIITRDVEVVGAGASLKEAVGRMKSLDVELLPVCDSDQLQGFLPIVILPYAQLRTVAMRKKLPSNAGQLFSRSLMRQNLR